MAYNLEQFSHLINALKAEKAIAQQTLADTLQHYQFDELQTDSNDIIAEMSQSQYRHFVNNLKKYKYSINCH